MIIMLFGLRNDKKNKKKWFFAHSSVLEAIALDLDGTGNKLKQK